MTRTVQPFTGSCIFDGPLRLSRITLQLQSVSLPSAPVRLTIILPRFSSPGQYLIAVTRDQSGNGVIAEGFASASARNGQERVSLDLDLRSAKAGEYFLSTTHEQDQAAYYYPLQIEERASK